MTTSRLSNPWDQESVEYRARVWRYECLRESSALEVRKMLQAFCPPNFIIEVTKKEAEQPGFPYAEKFHYHAYMHDPRLEGSDAHIFVQGYTEDDCYCRLLGLCLAKKGFFPMT